MKTYEVIEQRFAAWAQTQPPIRSVVVVGSQARHDPPADTWSDLDLIIFTTSPESFTSHRDWLSSVGKVWTAALEHHRAGDAEWQVIYEGGLKVDYLLARIADPGLTTPQYTQQAQRFHKVFGRGVRVLFDKNAAPTEITVPHEDHTPPTNAAIAELVGQFWLDITRIPKRLRRGELWRAKQSCDCLLKTSLLKMIEWHTQAMKPGCDTWYDGHFLEQWADPVIARELPATFAAYDVESIWQALFATMALFRRLAHETAEAWNYPLPPVADEAIEAWCRALYEER